MKKFVSVALATAMIASLGVTAFAKNSNDYDADVKKVTFTNRSDNSTTTSVADELYFPLVVTGKDGKNYMIADDAAAAKKTIADAEAAITANKALIEKYNKVEAAVNGVPWNGSDNQSKEDLKTALKGVPGLVDSEILEIKLPEKKTTITENDDNGVNISWDNYKKLVVAEYKGAVDRLMSKNTELTKSISAVQGLTGGVIAYDKIEDVDDLKVTVKLTAGEEYVADYSIDEIDSSDSVFKGYYGIVLELNDNYTTKKQKIKGTVTLKNKTKKLEEKDFSYNHDVTTLTISKDNAGVVNKVEECEFDGEDVTINLVNFNAKYNVAKFTKDVQNIELEDNNGFYFDVKASDQGKLNLTYDNVAIKSVAKIAPVDADLTFYNFYGYPEFDFTGTVTLTPEEDDVEYFVYKVAKDGKISKVNAKLNADGDAYEFKTRTLGCYVLSDMELDVDGMNADEQKPADKPEDGATTAPEAGKNNPGTGC